MPGLVSEPQDAPQVAKGRKPTKNELRRAKKKAHKTNDSNTNGDAKIAKPTPIEPDANHPVQPVNPSEDDPIQDVPDVALPSLPTDHPLYDQFADVFAKFQGEASAEAVAELKDKKTAVFYDDDDNVQDEEEEEETKKKLSKKDRKAKNKLSVAELKAIVQKPELVEWTDVSSQDPKLHVTIKSTRNVVPVPTHWSLKREYLSSKRGVEKAHYRLPQFIAETGIAEMRQNALDDQAEASLKQKARDRVNPKMNRLDIDFQKLFEAFFRRQTKPQLTRYGEVYYEGKEYETNMRHLRPGEPSDVLREALNMPINAPPPWLINMQKFGCPPSYPAMKVSGVNAPLPPGGKWGFEPGQYGKPPVTDEVTMTPLWGGDLFGTEALKRQEARRARPPEAPVSRALWGELQMMQEDEKPVQVEEEDDEEQEEEDADAQDEGRDQDIGGMAGLQTPFGGATTPSGLYSTTGIKSMAEEFQLRKQRAGGTDTETPSYPRAAGQVLQERSIKAEGFFGGSHAYDLKGADLPVLGQEDRSRKRKAGDLDVSVDVDALERGEGLSKNEIRKQYDDTRQRERLGQWQGKVDQEDLSAMIAEENAKRLRRNDERRGR